jgi:hypothetical protein
MYCKLCDRNLSPLETLGMSLLAGVAAVAAVGIVSKAVSPSVAGFDDVGGPRRPRQQRRLLQKRSPEVNARIKALRQKNASRTGDLAYIPISREERGLDAAQEYGWGY